MKRFPAIKRRFALCSLAAGVASFILTSSAGATDQAFTYWLTSGPGIKGSRVTVNNPSYSQTMISNVDFFVTSIFADARDGDGGNLAFNGIQQGVSYDYNGYSQYNCGPSNPPALYYFTEVLFNGMGYCYNNGNAVFSESHLQSVVRGSVDGNWYAYRDGQPTGVVTNWSACGGDACMIYPFGEESGFKFGEWYAKFAGNTPWQWWNGSTWQSVAIQNYNFYKTQGGHWSDPMGPVPGGIWHFRYLYQPPTSIHHWEHSPSDDTYVDQGAPSSNFGSSTEMRINARISGYPLLENLLPTIIPARDALLKFEGEPLLHTISSAKLRLCALSTSVGGDISVTEDTSWNENSVTWDGAPEGSTASVSLGPMVAGNCYDVDVTDLIWNYQWDGIYDYSFRISSSMPIEIKLASKEASSGAPVLIIDTAY